jgi:hypothetical protein
VATQIKEGFQSIRTHEANERHVQFMHQEAQGVYEIFLALQMTEETPEAAAEFEEKYKAISDSLVHETSNKFEIIDEIDKLDLEYEHHPAMRGVKMLREITPNKENVVPMHRAMLILLDAYKIPSE